MANSAYVIIMYLVEEAAKESILLKYKAYLRLNFEANNGKLAQNLHQLNFVL